MSKSSNTIKNKDIYLWVNIILFGTVGLLFFYYVMLANSITAKSYRVQELQDRVEELVEKNSDLMSQKIALESPSVLTKLALSQDLVEAKNVIYIFENKNVALKK